MTLIQPQKFEEVFQGLLDRKEKAVIIVTTEADAQGVYWCPDCEQVAPLYQTIEAEAKKAGLPLYKFAAGDRPTWKDLNNKFRKHPLLKIKSVPTMGYFNGRKLVDTLTEEDILKAEQRQLIYEAAQE